MADDESLVKKLIVPARRRSRSSSAAAVTPVRRRRPEDADRPLPAHDLDLRGQRRAGARRAGRQGRHGRRRPAPTWSVTMSYDAEVKVPADAKAVIIAPSIVGDRFVQLTPAYDGRRRCSPTAPSSTPTAPRCRSSSTRSTPSLDDLNVALGPDGRQQGRARCPTCSRRPPSNFGGQGAQFHQTIKDFGKLSAHPRRQQGGAVRLRPELEGFIGTLAEQRPDRARVQPVARRRLRPCSPASAQELGAVAAATSASALGEVSTFVRENRDLLGRNIPASTGSPRCWSSSAARSTRS